MTSEIEPVDIVWARERLIPRPATSTDPDDAVFIVQIDGTVMWSEPDKVIPDHPALPAVARWLRETPEARDAVTHAIGVMIGQWRTIQRMRSTAIRQSNDAAQWDATEKAEIVWKKIAVLKALLAALEAGS